jgi:hypothetical protein
LSERHGLRIPAGSRPCIVLSAGLPTPGTDATELTPAEREWMGGALAWIGAEGAYAAMHRTGGPAAD